MKTEVLNTTVVKLNVSLTCNVQFKSLPPQILLSQALCNGGMSSLLQVVCYKIKQPSLRTTVGNVTALITCTCKNNIFVHTSFKTGFHMLVKSQTIGDFTVSRSSQILPTNKNS